MDNGKKVNERCGVKDMCAAWLKEHGFDGLVCCELECGCHLEDFMPCEDPDLHECLPAYDATPDGEDHLMMPGRPARPSGLLTGDCCRDSKSEEENGLGDK